MKNYCFNSYLLYSECHNPWTTSHCAGTLWMIACEWGLHAKAITKRNTLDAAHSLSWIFRNCGRECNITTW